MKTTNNPLNQTVNPKDYDSLLLKSGKGHDNWSEKPSRPGILATNSKMTKNDDELEINQAMAAEAKFLSLLQVDTTQDIPIPVKNFGTIQRQKTLKEESQKTVSTFKIEFKDIGEAEIKVSQVGEGYSVSIDVQDKSKIPKNPLLFKKIVEEQLSSNLGVDFKLQVR